MGKFKVGDKVRILDAKKILGASTFGLSNGDITEIVSHLGRLALVQKIGRFPLAITKRELDYIELVNDNQRIKALEKRVEALERLAEDYFKVPVEPSTDDGEDTPTKTPNQLRAEIIEKAKGFVDSIIERGVDIEANKGTIGNETYKEHFYAVDFVTKENKVTSLVTLSNWKGIKIKETPSDVGRAKCNPSDVFNEHIGKAIALGRALGLDVSEFEGATQPTVAIGQIVDAIGEYTGMVRKSGLNVVDIDYKGHPKFKNGGYASHYKIINDTHTIYKEDKQ